MKYVICTITVICLCITVVYHPFVLALALFASMLGFYLLPDSPRIALVVLNRERGINAKLSRLEEQCRQHNQPVHDLDSLQLWLAKSNTGSIAVICGNVTDLELERACQAMRERGHKHVFIAVDALSNADGLKEVLAELDEEHFQLTTTAALSPIVAGKGGNYVHAYSKADATATVAVFFADGQTALIVERGHNPYKGCPSFPGGFLKPLLETLPECAARELKEETGVVVDPKDLILVDVRSAPARDERGHVVDHGYVWFVPAEQTNSVFAQIKAADDAASARVMTVSDLLQVSLAFDHKDLLTAALKLKGRSN